MKTKLSSALIVMLAFVSAFGTVPAAAGTLAASEAIARYNFTFDHNVKPFKAAALNPDDITAETLTLQYDYNLDNSKGLDAGGGNGYARLLSKTMTPIWMQARFAVPAGARVVKVHFVARTQISCQGCVTTVYIGSREPVSLSGFQSDYAGLSNRWSAHTYQYNIPSTDSPSQRSGMVIGIGRANLDQGEGAQYQTVQAVAFDNVTIEFE